MEKSRPMLAKTATKTRRGKAVREAAQLFYLKARMLAPVKGARQNTLLYQSPPKQGDSDKKRVRTAFICDEMTWQDFRGCCDAIFLHPKLWKEQLRYFQPEMLFCESAWSGIDAFADVWRGRIYRDGRVSFENRDILLEIIEYCNAQGIVTVFWNKEDPVFYAHPVYDFASTAFLFQHIFTTDEACAARYRAQGHSSVHILPFGVNTAMFYPSAEKPAEHSAFFAGSWYGDMPQRCRDLESLLDHALAQGWELDIYDRKSGRKEKRFRFPERYTPYVRQALPYHKMPELYRQYRFGINVNTVQDSPTMLSRRVLQLAACGVTIVTNDALALRSCSDCLRVWRPCEDGPVFAEGIPDALVRHSTECRFRQVLETVHITMERAYDYV